MISSKNAVSIRLEFILEYFSKGLAGFLFKIHLRFISEFLLERILEDSFQCCYRDLLQSFLELTLIFLPGFTSEYLLGTPRVFGNISHGVLDHGFSRPGPSIGKAIREGFCQVLANWQWIAPECFL